MKRSAVIHGGIAVAILAGLGGCGRETDPPALIQFTCSFEAGVAPMTVVIDTGLQTARWMNLSQPRAGSVRASPHAYQLDFPGAETTPAVRAEVNRYDATIAVTNGEGRTAVSRAGRCVKETTGPRL